MAKESAGQHAHYLNVNPKQMPAPHHSVYRQDELPGGKPTVSKHWCWRQMSAKRAEGWRKMMNTRLLSANVAHNWRYETRIIIFSCALKSWHQVSLIYRTEPQKWIRSNGLQWPGNVHAYKSSENVRWTLCRESGTTVWVKKVSCCTVIDISEARQ